jgi:Kinesin-associated protein (KAP)
MDVIEHELKRYDQMKQDLERRKNTESSNKELNKSQDNLDGTIMNVEKPKEVISVYRCERNFLKIYLFLDGTASSAHS